MRTVRSFTISRSMWWVQGLPPGGLGRAPGGRPPWRQTPSGCRTPWMQTPARQTPTPCRPPLWTEWQTGVETLPCPKLRLRAVIKKLSVYCRCESGRKIHFKLCCQVRTVLDDAICKLTEMVSTGDTAISLHIRSPDQLKLKVTRSAQIFIFRPGGGGGVTPDQHSWNTWVGHSMNFEPNFQPLQLATTSQIVSHILRMWRLTRHHSSRMRPLDNRMCFGGHH